MLYYRITTSPIALREMTATFAIDMGYVRHTSSNAKYMLRWHLFQVYKYADHFGWTIEQIPNMIVRRAAEQVSHGKLSEMRETQNPQEQERPAPMSTVRID